MKTTQHQQLAEDLLAQIADGTFAIGDRLPTEEQLCADYGLARGTVRRALGRLDELGLISRRPRAGTTLIASVPMAGYQPLAQSAADIVALAAETQLWPAASAPGGALHGS
jgi:DNA-binding GntR family transcriptional regulator